MLLEGVKFLHSRWILHRCVTCSPPPVPASKRPIPVRALTLFSVPQRPEAR
jgi:hypothetical protein